MDDLEETAILSIGDIRRLFPDPKLYPRDEYCNMIQMTNESVTSVTPFKVAKLITMKLKSIYTEIKGRAPTTIVDATANVGGNCISFAREFDHVIAIELKEKTMKMLKNNLSVYRITNVETHCGDFNRLIWNIPRDCNIIFIDPPWFIERQQNYDMILDFHRKKYPVTIEETIIRIWGLSQDIMIAIKVPKGYKCRINESQVIQYKKMDILIFNRNI